MQIIGGCGLHQTLQGLAARVPAVELPHHQAQVIAQQTAEVVCRPAQGDLEAQSRVEAERQSVEEVREGKVDLHSAPVDPPLQPDPRTQHGGGQHQGCEELTQQIPAPAHTDERRQQQAKPQQSPARRTKIVPLQPDSGMVQISARTPSPPQRRSSPAGKSIIPSAAWRRPVTAEGPAGLL